LSLKASEEIENQAACNYELNFSECIKHPINVNYAHFLENVDSVIFLLNKV
jgi:hypothetical protein